MNGLFRKDMLDAQRTEWLGSVHVATAPSHRVLLAVAAVFTLSISTYLALGRYTRSEEATGVTVPSSGLVSITAASSGVVESLLVRQGERVSADDKLVVLDLEQSSHVLGKTHERVGSQLDLQRNRIAADLADAKKKSAENIARIDEDLASLMAQLGELDAQLVIQHRRVESSTSLYDKFQPLVQKGYISTVQIQSQESALQDAQIQEAALRRQRLELLQKKAEKGADRDREPFDLANQIRDLERRASEIDIQLAENEAARTSVISATADAEVAAVLVHRGQYVNTGQALLSLIPRDSSLRVALLVPSRSVGFVRPDMDVALRYDAYPYQKFGLTFGRIANVSKSALTPAEVSASLGVQIAEPQYLIDVTIPSQTVMLNGSEEPLKPGMTVRAQILMESRSLLEWIFEPLYSIRRPVATAAS